MIILSTRKQRQEITFFILIIAILGGSITHTVCYSSEEAASVLQVHLGVDTHTVYHAEHFNMSLSILNVYGFEDIQNVSVTLKIPEELEIVFLNIPGIDLVNITDELYHSFGLLSIDEEIRLRVTYNVTSKATKSISIQAINVTYQLKNGIAGFVLSNSEDIGLRGIKETKTTESLRPIPVGEINELDLVFVQIPAAPFFSIIGYLFPLLFFGMSIVVLRRLRYIRT